MSAPRFRVQVIQTGTHEPVWRWHVVRAETAALAAREAVNLNCGFGGLGAVDVVSVEEIPAKLTPATESVLREALPFTRKAGEWDAVQAKIARSTLARVLGDEVLERVPAAVAFGDAVPHPCEDFAAGAGLPVVFELVLADGRSFLVNTEGYSYCRYLAAIEGGA